MNQTESEIFEIKNNSLDPINLEIQKEMERLGFYSAHIETNSNKIIFSIKGKYWTGKESAKNAFIFTDFIFFPGTSYSTKVYIKAYGD